MTNQLPDGLATPQFTAVGGQRRAKDRSPIGDLIGKLSWVCLRTAAQAHRYDRALAVHVHYDHDRALAYHATRITSDAERRAIARSLTHILHEARQTGPLVQARAKVHRDNVLAAEQMITKALERLYGQGTVDARGVARLRLLLKNRSGPLYRYGRGDLTGRLGAALAGL
jgi:hypothetical protein